MSHRVIAAASLALGLAACGGQKHYVRENADFSTMKTVTVLPFDNVTNDKLAAERVHRIFTAELLNLGAFEVVEPGLAARNVRRDQLDVATLSRDEIKRIGKELKVQAIFLGTLVEYDEGKGGSTPSPRVTIQLKLVETEKGQTLWSISRTGGGASVSGRLFGIGGSTAMEAAVNVIREELSELGW
jgi:hypothetical protein